MTVRVLIRKRLAEFNSIERVFSLLHKILGVQLIELKYHSKGLLNRIGNFLFAYKYRRDLVHLSGHDNYLFVLPIFKKSILTIHDIEGLYKYKGLKRRLYRKLWLELPLKNANTITSVSEFTKMEILDKFTLNKDVRVIHNSLSLSISFSKKEFNIERPRILQIGTKENKNISRLIDSLKGLACTLIIVGPVEKQVLKQLEENKIDNDCFTQLTNEELIDEYRKADILAFVSTYEGFGLPIIEAQAMGRVVLTSNLASMPEVAGQGAYFVDPFSVEAIRSGIEELIKNDDLREELIEKGRENVKRFDPKKIAAQYREIYDQIADEA